MSVLDYFYNGWYSSHGSLISDTTMLDSGVFPAFFVIEKEELTEVPTFILPRIAISGSHNYDNIVFNLCRGADRYGRSEIHSRTSKGLFDFISQIYGYSGRLGKAYTSKGVLYYGAKGALFDENYNPLCLPTAKVLFNKENEIVDIFDPCFRISPIILAHPTGMIEKTILTFASEASISNTITISAGLFNHRGCSCRVAIEDLSRFISRPNIPTPRLVNTFNNRIYNDIE